MRKDATMSSNDCEYEQLTDTRQASSSLNYVVKELEKIGRENKSTDRAY